LVGFNALVFDFGTIGQAYGICLFLSVAAFRFAVCAVEREGLILTAAAGFLASAAANSSLLVAPVAPVLLAWILFCNRKGKRSTKATAFLASGAIPLLPLAWLFAHGPSQTIFGVIKRHLVYRKAGWPGAMAHDFGVLLAWLHSVQALILAALAVVGLLLVWKGPWERAIRAEFWLCAWLAAAEIVFIANGHPNFEQYYVFTVPFLSILACAGLYAVVSRLAAADRPFWPVFRCA
jgi:hypothetical protein